MRHILGAEGRARLGQLLASRPLIGFDFDGTLAPIVEIPDQAVMPSPTASRLRALAAVLPVAIISGRALDDLVRRLAGMPIAFLAGNHGAEWSRPHSEPPGLRKRVRDWHAHLSARLAGLPGLVLEDKGLSLSVHYRGAPDPARTEAAIFEATGGLSGARSIVGNSVVNVVASESAHKGDALQMAVRSLGVGAALFAGDDSTDEDAFATSSIDPFVSIRVGQSHGSRAEWYLRDQGEVDELLDVLWTLRAEAAS